MMRRIHNAVISNNFNAELDNWSTKLGEFLEERYTLVYFEDRTFRRGSPFILVVTRQ